MLALSSANASRRCVDQTSCLTSFLVLARQRFVCFEAWSPPGPSARREAQLCLPRVCSRPLFSAVSAPCQPRRSNGVRLLSELFPRARLVVPPRLLGAALARGLVPLPAVVGRSACGCNAQHPRFSPLARLSATPLPQPVRRCSLAGPCARSRGLSSCSSAFAPVAKPCVSFAIAYCPCLLLHPHGRAQRVPRRHLRACLSRLAVARGAQLRTSLLLLLALRDAARRPRRCFLRRRFDLRLLRHRLSPWQARHCAVAAPGAKQCLGLPVRDAPLPRAVRCLRGVRVVCRSCVAATPLCVINARRARETWVRVALPRHRAL
ncbi:hypothetical protein ERJ75_000191500 [Trypanosoma vivax]|nr:hypothetical protein ERJ75_000191500 [Trypanosoma vivax]